MFRLKFAGRRLGSVGTLRHTHVHTTSRFTHVARSRSPGIPEVKWQRDRGNDSDKTAEIGKGKGRAKKGKVFSQEYR